MKLFRAIWWVFGFALFVVFSSAGAEEPTGPAGASYAEIEVFVHKLQEAVATRKPEAVAEFVSFPLRVNLNYERPKHFTRAQFIANFRSVFTPTVVAAVASQDPRALFQSSKGVMFGNGQIWVASVCTESSCTSSKLLIVSVNLFEE